jgi:hypothetical protein
MKTYKKTVAGRHFIIREDYFGTWTVWANDADFVPTLGAPPFSVGHRTKRQAIEFLDNFHDIMETDQ